MATTSRATLGEELAWHYANLARADMAVSQKVERFSIIHHMIRAKLYKGLVSGTMGVRSFFDDEKFKIEKNRCSYCDSADALSVDHLIPRKKLGSDYSENLILACRHCNSSKRERDMLTWLHSQGKFPSLMLLRRYLKLIYFFCQDHGLMDIRMEDAFDMELPFDLKNMAANLVPLYSPSQLSLEKIIAFPIRHRSQTIIGDATK
ncbi:hypothetical protein SDC9_85949 [bioreactor metagenome]|uniref:HNH nuclease domain-containing protein n=1 Tax=bioreactor metagenome TaxID=1076179 RepID=A0A644ZEM9_9ZZZZ